MNNAKIIDRHTLSEDEGVDIKPMLRIRQTELAEVIDALEKVNASPYWKVLQDKVFSKELNSLQNKLRNEKNPTQIYRLQGQLEAADKSDLTRLIQAKRNELTNIKNKLNAE